MMRALVPLVVAGAALFGCGTGSPGSRVDPSGNTNPGNAGPATVDSLTPSCSVTGGGADARVVFSTPLACDATKGSCSAVPLRLTATTGPDGATGFVTTWTVRDATGVVFSRTSQVEGDVRSTTMQLGSAFQGAKTAVFVDDGKSLTGRVDDRDLLSVPVSNGVVSAALRFADHQAAPALRETEGTISAVMRLLAAAHNDAPRVCQSGPQTAGPTAAVIARIGGALPSLEATKASETTAPRAASPVSARLQGVTVPAPSVLSTAPARVDAVVYAPQGVAPDFTGSTDQNTLLNWATPECQSCEHNCANSIFAALLQLASFGEACVLECFVPGSGCAQSYCGFDSACDNDQQCCGSVCCGPGTVCGDSSQGTCCPAADPVGCGDVTAVTCFVQGSSCCGSLDTACPPGQECTNTTGLIAQCCAPANVASDGACCDQPACGGQCCADGASCVNDSCCYGPVNSAGQCCSGFGESACGSSCCSSGQTCTRGDACCPSAQVCGSQCCQAGQACVDGACQGCASGTVACSNNGPSFCCATSTSCSPTGCCAAGLTFCPFDNLCETALDCIPPK